MKKKRFKISVTIIYICGCTEYLMMTFANKYQS